MPVNDVAITQELATETEQLNPWDVVTPLSVACEGTQGLEAGWCLKKILLISEL